MTDVPHPKDYERSDADPKLIAALALAIAIFLLGTPFLLRMVYPTADRGDGALTNPPSPRAPHLQVQPSVDLDRLHAYEHGKLETFGWADRDHTAVRIPIKRAMELLAERGLPGWPSPPASR